MLVNRLVAACGRALPDATVIVSGSLALGDYQPGESDVDLLVLSDAAPMGSWKWSSTPLSPQNCAAGQLEVKTFDQSVSLSNQIAFTLDVP